MPGMRKACKFNHIAEKSKIPRKSRRRLNGKPARKGLGAKVFPNAHQRRFNVRFG